MKQNVLSILLEKEYGANKERQVMESSMEKVSEIQVFRIFFYSIAFEKDVNTELSMNRWNGKKRQVFCVTKDKFYKAVVKPAMMFESECWAINRKILHRWEYGKGVM